MNREHIAELWDSSEHVFYRAYGNETRCNRVRLHDGVALRLSDGVGEMMQSSTWVNTRNHI